MKVFKGLYAPSHTVGPDEECDPAHAVLLERLEKLRKATVEDMASCGYWWQYMFQSGPYANWYTCDFTWRQLGHDAWIPSWTVMRVILPGFGSSRRRSLSLTWCVTTGLSWLPEMDLSRVLSIVLIGHQA